MRIRQCDSTIQFRSNVFNVQSLIDLINRNEIGPRQGARNSIITRRTYTVPKDFAPLPRYLKWASSGVSQVSSRQAPRPKRGSLAAYTQPCLCLGYFANLESSLFSHSPTLARNTSLSYLGTRASASPTAHYDSSPFARLETGASSVYWSTPIYLSAARSLRDSPSLVGPAR